MTKPTTTKLGAKIRSARKAKGLTQEELAAKVGVTKATINKYESGIVTNFSRPRIKALADALDISPLEFIGFESPQSITFTPKNAHKLTDLFSAQPPVIEVDPSQIKVSIIKQDGSYSWPIQKPEPKPEPKLEPEPAYALQPPTAEQINHDVVEGLRGPMSTRTPFYTEERSSREGHDPFKPTPYELEQEKKKAQAASMTDEEKELLRIYKVLPVKSRLRLLNLAYQLEEEEITQSSKATEPQRTSD